MVSHKLSAKLLNPTWVLKCDYHAFMAPDADELPLLPCPPIAYARYSWEPPNNGLYPRSVVRRQRGAYESAVVPEIAGWDRALPSELAADIEDATRALVDFDSHSLRVLGSGDPALGPISAILLRTESASSSQIEDLTTSARQLALAELAESDRANALTVVGNVRAMEAATQLSHGVDEAAVLAMHAELLRHQTGYEHHAGQLRDQLVWIGGDSAGPRGALFVAPQADQVRPALADLIRFVERDDLSVLVQVAVAHAHFETIHPFVDGNGRTGRAIAQALLRQKGLASHATVPLSAGLLTDVTTYFEALTAYRQGDAGPIVRRFAAASRFAAVTGRDLVDALAAELLASREALSGVRAHAAAWTVLPRLIGQPVLNARYLVEELGLSMMTAQRTLELLRERGVLVERSGRRRNRVWEHVGVLEVLDDYAERIRRGR